MARSAEMEIDMYKRPEKIVETSIGKVKMVLATNNVDGIINFIPMENKDQSFKLCGTLYKTWYVIHLYRDYSGNCYEFKGSALTVEFTEKTFIGNRRNPDVLDVIVDERIILSPMEAKELYLVINGLVTEHKKWIVNTGIEYDLLPLDKQIDKLNKKRDELLSYRIGD